MTAPDPRPDLDWHADDELAHDHDDTPWCAVLAGGLLFAVMALRVTVADLFRRHSYPTDDGLHPPDKRLDRYTGRLQEPDGKGGWKDV